MRREIEVCGLKPQQLADTLSGLHALRHASQENDWDRIDQSHVNDVIKDLKKLQLSECDPPIISFEDVIEGLPLAVKTKNRQWVSDLITDILFSITGDIPVYCPKEKKDAKSD